MNVFKAAASSTNKIIKPLKKALHLDVGIHQDLADLRRERIKSFKAKMDLKRGAIDKMADFMTSVFGSVWFLIFNLVWFGAWMLINTGYIAGIKPFDPFPYGLLTMIVSLEAIFLAIIVLISQNRAAHIAEMREEIDLQLNVKAEQEITKILIILDEIHDHLGLNPEDDDELIMMKQQTDLNQIEKDLEKEMSKKR